MTEDKKYYKLGIVTPYEYLQQKGIKKIHQPWKRYNFSIEELVSFLTEYSTRKNISLREVFEGLPNPTDDTLNLNYSNKIHQK